jgi:hypothetical protein
VSRDAADKLDALLTSDVDEREDQEGDDEEDGDTEEDHVS